jgi:hypothetical protein
MQDESRAIYASNEADRDPPPNLTAASFSDENDGSNTQSTHQSGTSLQTYRILHEVYCWFALAMFFPAYYYGGIPLFLLQTILGGGLACVIDWYISPTMKNNVQRIVQRGLSPSPLIPTSQWLVLLNIYGTIVTSEAIAVGLVVWTGGFQAQPHYDTKLLWNILLNMTVSEFIFTLSHRYFLHGTNIGAQVHEIHHTCRPSSVSTSFLFHFGDSMTEFTLTHVGMAAVNHCCIQDPLSLLCTLQITYWWYTVAGHSENLKLPHYFHHHFVSAHYMAYGKHKSKLFSKSPDCLRQLLEEKKQNEVEIESMREFHARTVKAE